MQVREFIEKYHSDTNFKNNLIDGINKIEHKHIIKKEQIKSVSKIEESLLRTSIHEEIQPSYKELNDEISSIL